MFIALQWRKAVAFFDDIRVRIQLFKCIEVLQRERLLTAAQIADLIDVEVLKAVKAARLQIIRRRRTLRRLRRRPADNPPVVVSDNALACSGSWRCGPGHPLAHRGFIHLSPDVSRLPFLGGESAKGRNIQASPELWQV